jgi:glucokinase
MNDMGVAALAMRRLKDEPGCNRAVLPGQTVLGGKILTVGIGTGLGDAYVDGDYVGQGEPGHHPFSPRDEVEDRLLAFAREELRDDIVSFEDVASGSKGLSRLYRFFQAHRELTRHELGRCSVRPPGIGRARQGRPPPAETMIRTGVDPDAAGFDPISFAVLVRLGDILGTYIGARAVAVSATGGIRLIGGVLSVELIELWLRYSRFEQRIRNMGAHRPMASHFEVGWVSHPYPGLVGAIEAALQASAQAPLSRA